MSDSDILQKMINNKMLCMIINDFICGIYFTVSNH